VLSIDAGKTLMLDGDGMIRAADAAGIAIVGRNPTSVSSGNLGPEGQNS
jgi:hypothetical protein